MKFGKRSIIAVTAFLVVFFGAVLYAGSFGPQMAREANETAQQFYRLSQKRDYDGARQLCTSNLRDELSAEVLGQRWQIFEARNGPIASWKAAGGGLMNITGDKVNLWPRFVDFNHTVRGENGRAGQVALRLVPDGQNWRIERVSIQPNSWIGAGEK